MAIMDNFIVPMIKTAFLVGIIGGISVLIIRYFYIRWSRRWKFFVKYKVMKNSYAEKDLKWIIQAIDMGLTVSDIKRKMLLNSQTNDRTFEMMWIFNQVEKEYLKGGVNSDGREFKRRNSKTQSTTELPNFKA